MNPLPDLRRVRVLEPRVLVNNERYFVGIEGGAQITYQTFPSTSPSTSNWNFNNLVPGKKCILDRIVQLTASITAKFNVNWYDVEPQGLLFQAGRFAFRQNPLSSIIQTLSCRFNGFPVTIELSDIVHCIMRFFTPINEMNKDISLYPNCPDNFAWYADADGTDRNPLGTYKDGQIYIGRGAYPFEVVTNTASSGELNANLIEYIILPPFIFNGSCHEAGGITNLDTLDFSVVTVQRLSRMFSMSTATPALNKEINTVGYNSLNVTVEIKNQKITLCWITPKLKQQMHTKDIILYPYSKLSRFITGNVSSNITIAPNATELIMSNVIQFDQMPRKLFIFVRKATYWTYYDDYNAVTTTDTYFVIDKANISWNNYDGQLSAANTYNLWELSAANGLNMNYLEYSGFTNYLPSVDNTSLKVVGLCGSILAIEIGKDIGLRDNEIESQLAKINFQVQLTVRNQNQSEEIIVNNAVIPGISPEVVIYTLSDEVLQIGQGSATAYRGIFSESDALNSELAMNGPSYLDLQKMYGGDFFGTARQVGSRAIGLAKKLHNVVKDNQLVSKGLDQFGHAKLANAARALGYGATGYGAHGGARPKKSKGGILYGGVLHGGNIDMDENDDMYGGMLVSKNTMARKLKK